MTSPREASVQRQTKETEISIDLTLPDDGPVMLDVSTPVPFLSHMLEAFGKHASMKLRVEAKGDVEIDDHHTVEDTGLVLGAAIDQALGPRVDIVRFGHFSIAMDDTMVDCALDLGGRPYLVFDVPAIAGRRVGNFDCDLVREFFQAVVVSSRMNLHLHLRAGGNAHHVVEACFKAFARAFRMACGSDPAAGVPSTKGEI
jgi:imidazoleglycerol-phosphate dehydratase